MVDNFIDKPKPTVKKIALIHFLVVGFIQLMAQTQYQEPKIFSIQDGLSSSKINNTIVQDEKGFIWIGSEYGLNKFDGYRFDTYKNRETDSTSIANNIITALFYDSFKRLWVGTMMGLQYYNPQKNDFKTASFGEQKDIIERNPVIWIMEDSQKNIWFSVENKGVIKYSLKTNQVVLYKSIFNGGELCSNSIRNIVEDDNRNIWFGSLDNGITVYQPGTNSFHQYNTVNSNLRTNSVLRMRPLKSGKMLVSTLGAGVYILDKLSGKFIETPINATAFSMIQDNDNSILVGTEGDGLWCIDADGKNIYRHPAISSQMKEIINSKIHCLFFDNNDDLWIAMYNDGICYLRKEPPGFVNYKRDYDNSNSLSYGQVTGITSDKRGDIWFATDGGGLNKYNKSAQTYTHYRYGQGSKHSLTDDAVVSVFCDSKGIIWGGTYTGGLCKFDGISGLFVSYKHIKGQNSPPGNYIKCIVEDQKQNLWLGTDGSGISYFNPASEKFVNYSKLRYRELISDNITYLYLQNNTTLWIGTHSGICNLDIPTQKFKSYDNSIFIATPSVYSIAEDAGKQFWIGTSSGLYLYDPDKDTFIKRELPNELQNSIINAIVPYENRLWVSTNKGIISYDTKEKQIKNFISNNDLGGTNFIRSSSYLSPWNEIFFGGGKGAYSFFPNEIKKNESLPKVYITSLKIFDQPVYVGQSYNGRTILEKSLDETDMIVLKHNENSLTLQFSAPIIQYPASTSYLCFMEGVDKQWIRLEPDQRSITYANLSPGTYTFNVYANRILDTPIKNVTTLTIEILPPVWLTWWAKVSYIILGILLLSLVMWVIYIRLKDKNELNIERLKAKKQEELNLTKMQFFTNISHEFRTPLTLIISPLKEIEQTEPNQKRAHLMKMMLRNADRLLRLINQILDLRKIEYDKIQVHARPINLVLFVQDFVGLFTDTIDRKQISVSFNYEAREIPIWYDPDLLEKCLYNLLFNALKYTPDGNSIFLSIKQKNDGSVLFSIRDTGCGIAPEDLPHIFDRFYQGSFSQNSGTGIGLHLVKTIVELHHGKVWVESEVGVGSNFTLYIQAGKNHLDPQDYDDTPWSYIEIEQETVVADNYVEDTGKGAEPDNPLILLVEDEYDMRMYLHHELSVFFNIVEANNGREALNKLQHLQPNIIVTDVMMPEMSGIEFTKIVKENIETCHIPVVLLTANEGLEQKLEGIETGADAYITKPFDANYLRIRIIKLLETREKIQKKFSRLLNLEAQEIDVTDPDELLLQNSINYIRTNISETDLSVEDMAKKLNISRTNLHRKIKTLTGSSPIELIRIIRMKQAAYLLEKGSLTISEVAYEVGYNSLSYFSSSFNTYWGISPSAYVKSRQTDAE